MPVHHHFCSMVSPAIPLHHHHLHPPPDHLLFLFSRFKHLLLPSSPHTRCRYSSNAACSRASSTSSPSSSFYAGDGVSWKSLGVSDDVSSALSSVALRRPSLVQAACIPQILSGKDVIVAAETGSGKTHGYLVPLIHKLRNLSEQFRKASDGENAPEIRKSSLILCPNVMLCEQVVKMANALCGDCGEPLIRVSSVCGRHGWPVEQPDIIVSTPAALLNSLYALGAGRRRRPEFLRDLKYVVFDEADMLLCGSFQNQVIRLINLFRFEEKQLSRMGNSISGCSSKVENESASSTLEDESDSFKLEDGNKFVSSNLENESDLSNLEDKSEIVFKVPDVDGLEITSISEGDQVDADEILESCKTEVGKFQHVNGNDWCRVRRLYKRSKQYIFVAATLPENGKKTAGGVLKHMFPNAIWVSGDYLHRQNPRLEQRWIKVSIDTQVDALIGAVNSFKSDFVGSGSGVNRTMVFANTVDAAESVAKILQQADIECLCYHSDGSLEERTKKLASFREKGGVLVCTDAAARGLDIPNVFHVIQAEFATSAVDFLHRIGRTARAGQHGVVTSLYTECNRDLVSAVKQAEKSGQAVEKAFSRKRSFRNKLKKRALKVMGDSHSVGVAVA